ncbi:hypothetical protein GWK47_011680 [Chionoecetes opilio]|uniref:Uncharacterized protein n=1 Tax=Chionoecetes opilio TaxID=41210 RepID=A0A8J4Y641_CHIOP|nr:hypothetical protein GWK47_011680 [Chionoecetes opilio]
MCHTGYTTKPGISHGWLTMPCCWPEAKYSAWLRFKRNPTRRNQGPETGALPAGGWWCELCSGEDTGNGGFSVPAAGPAVEGRLRFVALPLPLQEAVKVLGVEVDRELRFDGHIKHIAKKASHRVSFLRRVARFLDRGGKLLLYKAQIRPYLDYAALSGCRVQPRTLGGWTASSVEPCDWWMLQTPQTPRPPSPIRAGESSRLTGNTAGMSRRLWYSTRHRCRECHTWLGYDSLRESPREARERCFSSGGCSGGAAFPVLASTNAPLWAASPRMWNIFKGRCPSHPGDEPHTV